MKILKPKRASNGTYEGLIYKNSKKDLVKIRVEKAIIVDIKQNKDNDYYLTLKQKSIAKDICVINEKIIDYVKENCGSWFKNNLSDDLIEDYFTSNILYDKDKGQLIRFKCTNDISVLSTDTSVNIVLSLKLIRFYKQKFVVEWEVEEIEIIDNLLFQSDIESDISEEINDDDIPTPDEEELSISLNESKTHYNQKLNDQLLSIQKQILSLTDKENILKEQVTKLNSIANFYELSSLCHDLDKLLE